jgi:thiamine biosynthesis lipoprotein
MKEFRRYERLMGSDFEFIIVADHEDGLLDECVAEVKRIEVLLTEFSETSFTAKINQASGEKAVEVDREVFNLLKRCKELSKLTQGAFDITSGLLKKLYNFKGQNFIWPDDQLISDKLKSVGYEKINLIGDEKVFLTTAGMHIGFGAIGKGYAADRVRKLMQQKGVLNGVINASGDLTAWGKRADGTSWKIGIADPDDTSKILAWLPIENGSVATSGDYEQFIIKNGIRYAHNVDPKNGRPVKGIKSVTIVSSSAELCDALATAVFVMGPDIGIHFINQLPGVHGLIVNDQNKIFTSHHINIKQHEEVFA